MNRSSKRRRQTPDPELQRKQSQRRDIVMLITSDDMKLRLKQLADEGRQQDCLALMHELGDWQSYGRITLAPILHAPYIGIS
ncbi:hypothetical protein KR52_12220 [Synechococcus sp. KORDI-52]|uniref:hypothetical protein n=1 Tax=Synechococcus sp. KORDI-52 TaxID=585425 RepID=UPI0004E07B75|nr:hypothetical protein [Synechococcus sp. KORDI-52]AII49896.1 hypothetical protein KR52_12220 [Synechococcus sp. KORDI-52]